MSHTFRLAVVLCLLAVLVAACGGDEGADTSTTSTVAATTTTSTTAAPVTTTTEPVDTTEILLTNKWTNTVDGRFEHSGGAVDAGVMCPDGRFKFSVEIVDEDPGKSLDSVAISEYTCSDGSGTFTTESTYHTTISGGNSTFEGLWEVLSGTDAYATIQGGGTLSGACTALASGCDAEAMGAVTP